MEPNLTGYTVTEADLQGVIEAQGIHINTLQQNHAMVLRALAETQTALAASLVEIRDLKKLNPDISDGDPIDIDNPVEESDGSPD